MEIIETDNIKKLISFPISIGAGCTARCYKTKEGNVIKIYKHNRFAKELLARPFFEDNMRHIDVISNETFIGPKKLVYQDGKIVGYIYELLHGKTLSKLSSKTRLSTVVQDLDVVFENIKKISQQKFALGDVHTKNIIFDGGYRVIDLDQGGFLTLKSEEEIYLDNARMVIQTIFDQIYGTNIDRSAEYTHVKVDKYINSDYLSMKVIELLCDKYRSVCNSDNPTIQEIKDKTLSYYKYRDANKK